MGLPTKPIMGGSWYTKAKLILAFSCTIFKEGYKPIYGMNTVGEKLPKSRNSLTGFRVFMTK